MSQKILLKKVIHKKKASVFVSIFISIFFISLWSDLAVAYEEPKYDVVKKTDIYEIRLYGERTIAEVVYGKEDNGFKSLFNYISGDNKGNEDIAMTVPVTQSVDIEMTAPVTQSTSSSGKQVMRFFLPEKYTKETTPTPTNPKITIKNLPKSYIAAITYSGFASDSNFEEHAKKLKIALKKDKVIINGEPIKATYNSPFTLPFFRRNEALIEVAWEE